MESAPVQRKSRRTDSDSPTKRQASPNRSTNEPSPTSYKSPTSRAFKEKDVKPKRSSSAGSLCLGLIGFIFTLATIAMSISYIIHEDLTFGKKLPNWRKYLPRSEIVLTPEELAQYDGSDPSKPIYLAIKGRVYDVTAGSSYYGKGGGYSFFSGKDATRSYITGCFQTHLTHDLRGLSDNEIKSLDQWTEFYENHDKYFYVGKVLNPPIDPDSPIPEPCDKKDE